MDVLIECKWRERLRKARNCRLHSIRPSAGRPALLRSQIENCFYSSDQLRFGALRIFAAIPDIWKHKVCYLTWAPHHSSFHNPMAEQFVSVFSLWTSTSSTTFWRWLVIERNVWKLPRVSSLLVGSFIRRYLHFCPVSCCQRVTNLPRPRPEIVVPLHLHSREPHGREHDEASTLNTTLATDLRLFVPSLLIIFLLFQFTVLIWLATYSLQFFSHPLPSSLLFATNCAPAFWPTRTLKLLSDVQQNHPLPSLLDLHGVFRPLLNHAGFHTNQPSCSSNSFRVHSLFSSSVLVTRCQVVHGSHQIFLS